MSSLSNKQLVRSYYEEVFNTGNVDPIADYVSEDYVEVHDNTRHPIGIDGARAHVLGVRETYPDLRLTVDRQISEGEWVVTLGTMRGTHLGEWQGIPPTGETIEVTFVNVDRVVDRRIVEHGGAANLLGPLLKTGAVKISGRTDE
jgi:predicted ester cyclase